MTTARIPTESSSIATDSSPSCSEMPRILSNQQLNTPMLQMVSSSDSISCGSFESVESCVEEAFGIVDTLEKSKAKRMSDALKRTPYFVGGNLDASDRLSSDGSERIDYSDRDVGSELSMNFEKLIMSERTIGGSNRYAGNDFLAQSERSVKTIGSAISCGSEKLLDNSRRLSFLMSSTRFDAGDDLSSSDESDMDEPHYLYDD